MKNLLRVQIERGDRRPQVRGRLRVPSSPGSNGPERHNLVRVLIDVMTVVAIIIRVLWEVIPRDH
jgi:hypothetical protein